MKINYKTLIPYYQFVICLFLLFWCLSFYEAIASLVQFNIVDFIKTIVLKCLNDFLTCILIGLILVPIYLILTLLRKNLAVHLFRIFFIIIFLIQTSLVLYSKETYVNLGADLLSYSLSDLIIALKPMHYLLLPYMVFVCVAIVFFLILENIIKKTKSIKSITRVHIVLLVISLISGVSISSSQEVSNTNKIFYLVNDIKQSYSDSNNRVSYNKFVNSPEIKRQNKTDSNVLSKFINTKDKKSNIVVILFEGLGSEFVDGRRFSGFTPFLDSLIIKSLFWENFVSTTGRTFGVVPSVLGSLPFGDRGFMELNPYPKHHTLISVLKSNNYHTSFYAGHDTKFERLKNFINFSDIDNIVDEIKYENHYVKTAQNSGGYSWGYPDKEIYRKTLATLKLGKASKPQLNIVINQTLHEPFNFPELNVYLKKVDSILKTSSFNDKKMARIEKHKNIFASLLYVDKSLKMFMEEYKNLPDYENTIFVITGDHRLIPINQTDRLCRFHVPLIIYSPLQKKAERFKSISSHWNITPSIVSFLKNNYKFKVPEETGWMGGELETEPSFRNIHNIPLMRYKGKIGDFIFKDYLLSSGKLYKIKESISIYKKNRMKRC